MAEQLDPQPLLRAYEQQGLILDRVIASEMRATPASTWQGGVLAGLREAAKQQRRDPEDVRFAHGILHLTEEIAENIALRAMATVANSSIERAPPAEVLDFRAGAQPSDMCSRAEMRFVNAVRGLAGETNGRNGADNSLGSFIIHDRGHVLFVRKRSGAPTALALSDFATSGIVWPAGTLVDLTLTHEKGMNSSYKKGPRTHRHAVEWVSINDVAEVSPARLTAFAFPPEDRSAALDQFGLRQSSRWGNITLQTMKNMAEDYMSQQPADSSLSSALVLG